MAELEKLDGGAKLSLNHEEMWLICFAADAGIDRESQKIGSGAIADETAARRIAIYRSLKSLILTAVVNQ